MTQFQFHTLNLDQIARHSIGFDRMFEDMERHMHNGRSTDNYPPHNVIQLDETHYVIEIAVSGFAEEELNIELQDNVLNVTGEKIREEAAPKVEYLHKGIGTRNFTRNFSLAENVQVCGATVKNGILAVALERIIPDEQKPKKIAISFTK